MGKITAVTENTESALQNVTTALQNTDSALKDTETALQNTDSTLKDTDSTLKDTESALKILRRPSELRRKIERLRQHRDICQARCTRLTTSYSSVRVCGNKSSPEDFLTALADINRDLAHMEQTWIAAQEDLHAILSRLAAMPDRCARRDALLLELRHVRELPWDAVRRELYSAGFPATGRTIYHWYHAALNRFSVIAPEQH